MPKLQTSLLHNSFSSAPVEEQTRLLQEKYGIFIMIGKMDIDHTETTISELVPILIQNISEAS